MARSNQHHPMLVLDHRVLGGASQKAPGGNAHALMLRVPGKSNVCQTLMLDAGARLLRPGLSNLDHAFPDLTPLLKNMIGIVVSHGHNDHMLALRYLAGMGHKLPPVFADRYTAEVIRLSFFELGLPKSRIPKIVTLEDGVPVQIGDFKVIPVAVGHSLPCGMALFVDTPAGRVFYSGDFNADPTLVLSPATDFDRLAQIAGTGVDLALIDNCQIHKDKPVRGADFRADLTRHITAHEIGPVVISTCGAYVEQLGDILAVAALTGRPVVVAGGGSIDAGFKTLEMSGIDPIQLVKKAVGKAPRLIDGRVEAPDPDDLERAIILTDGAQGAPDSPLAQSARGDHPWLVMDADTLVIRTVPTFLGRDAPVADLFARLKKLGVTLIDADALVRPTTHAPPEDMIRMITAVPSRMYLPMHGSTDQAAAFRALVWNLGKRGELLKNGDLWRIEDGNVRHCRHYKQRAWIGVKLPETRGERVRYIPFDAGAPFDVDYLLPLEFIPGMH
ncbi:MAG: ribonuclease J [Pseudomonadota bacterium]|nr:ribonuclease J [Pseudomonadota bacterium]